MTDLRDDILSAFQSHAKGHIDKHRMNIVKKYFSE